MSSSLAIRLTAFALALSACDGTSASDAGSEDTAANAVAVTWIDVVASDYTLELVPEFDRSVTTYQALADGPGIEVRVDVIVNADVDAVRVNGVPAESAGFRLWRSTPQTGLVAPTMVAIEIEADGATAQSIDIDIVHE